MEAEEMLKVFRKKQKELTGGDGCFCNSCVECMQAVLDEMEKETCNHQ